MPWRVELSEHLAQSIIEYSAGDHALRARLDKDVRQFVILKMKGGPTALFPSSADKPSGWHGNGAVAFQAYIDNGFHHCHLDYVRADPMIVYRVILAERKIIVVCIATHDDMFKHKKMFVQAHATQFPRTKRK